MLIKIYIDLNAFCYIFGIDLVFLYNNYIHVYCIICLLIHSFKHSFIHIHVYNKLLHY